MDPGFQEASRGDTSKAMTSSSSVVVEGDEARMKGLEWATDIHGGGEMVVGGGDEPLTMQGFSSRWAAAQAVNCRWERTWRATPRPPRDASWG